MQVAFACLVLLSSTPTPEMRRAVLAPVASENNKEHNSGIREIQMLLTLLLLLVSSVYCYRVCVRGREAERLGPRQLYHPTLMAAVGACAEWLLSATQSLLSLSFRTSALSPRP
jgi:hypothetical protein